MRHFTTMTNTLPTENGLIKLKHRHFTLADVVDDLIEMKDRLIRKISKEKLENLTKQSEFDLVPPFVIMPVYKTFKDKENNNLIHMVFANHGQVPYCAYEVLESYKLDQPKFFWGYKISENQPHHYRFSETYCFSDDENAFENWQASLNYDEIFEHFALDGGEDLAGFAGFFWVTN